VIAPVTRRARRLRIDQTDAEKKLWRALRDRQLGAKFRRQHPVGRFILDFACFELRLAIEVDGGQHNTGEGLARDERRRQYLADQGWRILRFWNNDVTGNTQGVLEMIADTVRSLTPNPSPEGEGSAGHPLSPRERGAGGEA